MVLYWVGSQPAAGFQEPTFSLVPLNWARHFRGCPMLSGLLTVSKLCGRGCRRKTPPSLCGYGVVCALCSGPLRQDGESYTETTRGVVGWAACAFRTSIHRALLVRQAPQWKKSPSETQFTQPF